MRKRLQLSSLLLLLASLVAASQATAATPRPDNSRPPNLVLLFADDLGYGDLSSFKSQTIRTPNIDRLGAEGTRFTSFYVAQAVCTASRAGLLTGCYPNRVGLQGALNHTSNDGIAPSETLLPELCKSKDYATAIYGKWHLGHRPPFIPTRNGFDHFVGIPYSNDNGPLHPVIRDIPPLPLFDNDQLVAHDPDQSLFTRTFTEKAIAFIEQNKDRPFFLYVPHVMPHVPIFASEAFKGQSPHGLYADVVEELDWSVGQILGSLDRLNLAQNTLVIFLSDNGPFLSYGTHAGSAAPFREGKLTSFEGGVRSPCLMRWPGRIPAGRTCDEPLMTIDLLPSWAAEIAAPLPDHTLDGRDIRPVLFGEPGATSPHEAYFFYAGEELQAVRSGPWKLHFAHDYLTVNGPPGTNGKPANYANMKPASIAQSGLAGIASRHGYKVAHTELALYNLHDDPAESQNLAATRPEIVNRLEALAQPVRQDLGDTLTNTTGLGLRPPGRYEAP